MKVYRVEDRNGKGPYRKETSPLAADLDDAHKFDPLRPPPRYDG